MPLTSGFDEGDGRAIPSSVLRKFRGGWWGVPGWLLLSDDTELLAVEPDRDGVLGSVEAPTAPGGPLIALAMIDIEAGPSPFCVSSWLRPSLPSPCGSELPTSAFAHAADLSLPMALILRLLATLNLSATSPKNLTQRRGLWSRRPPDWPPSCNRWPPAGGPGRCWVGFVTWATMWWGSLGLAVRHRPIGIVLIHQWLDQGAALERISA